MPHVWLDGYLTDPEDEYGRVLNPGLVTLSELRDIPCVCLLGERGIGKSQELAQEEKSLELAGQEVDRIRLWGYQTDERLCKSITKTRAFRECVKGAARLHLLLDGLDEGLMPVDDLAKVLVEELGNYRGNLAGLRLRITCRTAQWPGFLESALEELWGSEGVAVYQLATLRKKDVEIAAGDEKLPAAEFLAAVEERQVVPLAVRPITLRMLLKTYSAGKSLPQAQAALYEKGCLNLCEESYDRRRGPLSAAQCLAVAARIGAVTEFANKAGVEKRSDAINRPEHVTVQELCGGSEYTDGKSFDVTEEGLLQTLDTGLFTGVDGEAIGWSHQSYGEFLAAWYLKQHAIPSRRAVMLVTGVRTGDKKTVPQLRGVAAWAAMLCPGVFDGLLRNDPTILLEADLGSLTNRDRERAVSALLKDSEKGTGTRALPWSPALRGLNHPGLARQLGRYVTGRGPAGAEPRRLAIAVAEGCVVREIVGDILAIARDVSEPVPLRVDAAYAILRIGDDEAKNGLKPLLSADPETDPDGELRGCALGALWPQQLCVDEVVDAISSAKRTGLIGSLRMFLEHEFVQRLRPKDLPAALRWASNVPGYNSESVELEDAANSVFVAAWDHLENQDVLDAWVTAADTRLSRDYHLLGGHHAAELRKKMLAGPERRRKVLAALVSKGCTVVRRLRRVLRGRTALIRAEDVPWLIGRLAASTSDGEKEIWAKMISGVLYFEVPPRLIDQVLVACAREPVLKMACARHFEAVDFKSPDAMKAKQAHYAQFADLGKAREDVEEGPPELAGQLLEDSLKRFESGDVSAWAGVLQALGARLRGDPWGGGNRWDPTQWPGWQSANAEGRRRIIGAGLEFVRRYRPTPLDRIRLNSSHVDDLAGYCALRLALREAKTDLQALSKETWAKWSPPLVRWGSLQGAADRECHAALIAAAYKGSPDELIDCLPVLVSKENDQELPSANYLRNVEPVWDDRIEGCLLEQAYRPELTGSMLLQLLRPLLQHRNRDAKEFAKSLIPLSADVHEPERACAAARALFAWADDAGWDAVYPYVEADRERAKQVLLPETYSPDDQGEDVAGRLGEERTAGLFLWLCQEFPYSEGRPREGVIAVTAGSRLADLRDALLRALVSKGSPEAVRQVRRTATSRPDLKWLRWHVQEAEVNLRQKSWTPLAAQEVIDLGPGARRCETRKGALRLFFMGLVLVVAFNVGLPKMAATVVARVSEALMFLGLLARLGWVTIRSGER